MTATQAKAEAKPATLIEALLAVKAELPVAIAKDKANPHFKSKYVSLDAIMETVTPVLTKHGLIWVTLPGRADEEYVLEYQLRHASGELVGGVMPLVLGKSDMQGLGSAITYARRYSLMAVLGLTADEDDDGNKAAESPRAAAKPAAPQPEATNGGVLSDESRLKVLQAIEGKGQPVGLTLAAVGVSKPEELTSAHAHQIKDLLDRIA